MAGSESREAAERDYDVLHSVPEAHLITERWPERAAAFRARHTPLPDIRYGDHPRETLDLFRAAHPVGTVLFIHGGGWQVFSKEDFSWVAEGFVDQGLSVAILNYPLCPEVTLSRIASSTRRGFAHLWREVLEGPERARVAVTGHSAGGYLAALHLATDWAAFGLPADPIAAVVPISGVFSLTPLALTGAGEEIGLGLADAQALSLGPTPPRSRAALTLVVGHDEADGFKRQADGLASSWSGLAPRRLDLPGRNHFDVIDGLAEPGSELNRAVLQALDGR